MYHRPGKLFFEAGKVLKRFSFGGGGGGVRFFLLCCLYGYLAPLMLKEMPVVTFLTH